tara:strand:+ start:1514 stop:1924 length:411 start_codon:yes stop_codon:yes gene_type:complete
MKKTIKKTTKVVNKKPTIYTQFGNTPPLKGKIMSDKIMTIPDQTKTIRELLDNHSRGIPLGVNEQKGEYFDTPIPVFTDLTDIMEYKHQLKEKEAEVNKLIAEEKAKKLEELKKTKPDTLEAEQAKKEIEKIDDQK